MSHCSYFAEGGTAAILDRYVLSETLIVVSQLSTSSCYLWNIDSPHSPHDFMSLTVSIEWSFNFAFDFEPITFYASLQLEWRLCI